MADLVADARLVDYTQVKALWVAGSAAVDDGGGGLYIWDAASTAADDGAEIIKPTAIDAGSPGRWKRVSKNIEDYAPAAHTHSGVYQPVDATLTALAGLNSTAGVVYQTGADAFEKRAVGTGANTIAAGDHSHLSAQANNAFTSGPLFWAGTQAQYDILTPDANTVYVIV